MLKLRVCFLFFIFIGLHTGNLILDGNPQDFSMLSCSNLRNITIAMYTGDFTLNFRDTFLRSLNELILNEHCFMINFYLNSEDRVVRVRKNDDIYKLIERNRSKYGSKRLKTLIERIYKEGLRGDVDIKQSFVHFVADCEYYYNNNILESLRKLQEDRNWDILVLMYYKRVYPIKWIPSYRYFQVRIANNGISPHYDRFLLMLKQFIDVMKNPDFNAFGHDQPKFFYSEPGFGDICVIYIPLYLFLSEPLRQI